MSIDPRCTAGTAPSSSRRRPSQPSESGSATAEAGMLAVTVVAFVVTVWKIAMAPTMNDLLEQLFVGALNALF